MKTKRQSRIKIVDTPENKLRVAFNELPNILKELTDRAARDDGHAWTYQAHLLEVLTDAVERMNESARQHPEHWRWLAEQRREWPVMVSLHPHDIKGMEPGAAVREFLETVKLGSRFRLRLAPGTQLDNPAVICALALQAEIEEAREVPRQFRQLTGWKGKAQRLGEPVKANAPQWWKVADELIKADGFPCADKLEDCHRKDSVKDYEFRRDEKEKVKRAFLKLFPPSRA